MTGRPAPAPTDRVDVVVVGAGVAGLSAAAALAERHRVVVVEQESTPAHHASGRSASVLSETSGHPLVCALARLSRPFFESPPDGFADHPLLAPRGLLWLGEPGDEQTLDRLAEAGRRVAPTVRRLDAEGTRAIVPTFHPHVLAAGAVWEPDAMAVDAAALLQGFVRMLKHHGGSVVLSAEAIGIHRVDDGWHVVAGTHTFATTHVVNASGGWGDVVAARAGVEPLGLTPFRRTAAIARADVDVTRWPLVMDVMSRWYCEPETGGLLISPAEETLLEPCDATADELDVALALDRVREATGLPLRSIVRAWAGLRTFAPDRAPVIGEDPDAAGFWWLVGQGGAGIKTAPAMADLLARQIRGDGPTDAELTLGVTPDAVTPARLRSA